MARQVKQEPIRKLFFKELSKAIGNPSDVIEDKSAASDDIWKEKPVSMKVFFDKWIREPLFPEQLAFVEGMLGENPLEWDDIFDEGHAFWGKGSGKDRTVAKLFCFTAYWLMCLKNPHKYLREKYRASLGDEDSIDMANISINARQAENVFFKKLKSITRRVKNPNTGKNWFEEHGVDLRDGYGILKNEIKFTEWLSCYSLNSDTYTGEGLNLFIVVIDEFGAFPGEKAFNLLDSVRSSVESRFPNGVGKTLVMSYKYKHNCPMTILFKENKDNVSVLSSQKATWEVNLIRLKSDFAKTYLKNPEKAKMTYECSGGEDSGGYVSKKYMIKKMFSDEYVNPIKGNLHSIKSSKLASMSFEKDFTPDPNLIYIVHFDLSSGKKSEGRDAAGFAMAHVQRMFPKYDQKILKDLAKEGIMIEMARGTIEDEEKISRKGIIVDLHFQIVADIGGEIQLSDCRKLIMRLKSMGFNINYASYDGWQSKDSVQILNEAGIDAYEFSVDKDIKHYDTWKELMYQQLVKTYYNPITDREARELELSDAGKVDHPEKSWERLKLEGTDKGSKDVMDCIAAVVSDAYEKIPIDSNVFFG